MSEIEIEETFDYVPIPPKKTIKFKAMTPEAYDRLIAERDAERARADALQTELDIANVSRHDLSESISRLEAARDRNADIAREALTEREAAETRTANLRKSALSLIDLSRKKRHAMIHERDAARAEAAALRGQVAALVAEIDNTYRLLDECDHAGRSAPECPYCNIAARLDTAALAAQEPAAPDARDGERK